MPVLGLDCIGLLGYSNKTIDMIMQEIPAQAGLGVLLDTTFNTTTMDPLRRALSSGKVSFLFPDLLNTTAVRNRVLQPKELLKGYTIPTLEKDCMNLAPRITDIIDHQVFKLLQIAQEFPSVAIFPSLFLEHDLSRTAAGKVVSYVMSKGLWATWIDNPLHPYAQIPGTYLETHGNEAHFARSISNDGSSFWDCDPENFKQRASDIVMAWIHEFNKNFTGGKTFVAPLKRTVEVTRDQIQHLVRVLWNAPQADPLSPGRLFKKPELFKVMAEDYKGKDDGRGSKPMVITMSRAQKITIHRLDGKLLGWYGYYGSFGNQKGYNRHYLGKFAPKKGQTSGSGQTALQIVQKAGSEWVLLKDGNTTWRVNMLRRAGYFHI